MGSKVDSQTFPTSYLEPDLDTGKALKQSCQCARPVKVRGATTQGNLPVLTSSTSKTLFSPWLIFEGSNQLQIQKFWLGWKVDFQKFPTSYPTPDLDSKNALKQSCQYARPVKVSGATTQGNFTVLTSSTSKTLFLLWLTFEACK